MTDAYRVTSPYVTLKVLDQITGSWTTLGYYVNALLPTNANAEDVERLLRKGMVEKLGGPAAKQADQQRAEEERAAAEKLKQATEEAEAASKAAADEAKAPLKATGSKKDA
jgi:regulator of protease activity HflC (stomatin/prohibitin superfamily)